MDDVDAATANTLTAAVPTIWPLPAPARLTPLTAGRNNLVYRVETAERAPCILRVYRNHADEDRVRHEVALLAALRAAAVPFAVPAPLSTRAGVLVHQLQAGAGPLSGALAVLCSEIAGAHPDPDDVDQAQAAGAALALLDLALASIDPAILPRRDSLPLHDLRRRTAAPDDVESVLMRLPLPTEDTASLVRQLRMVEEEMQPLHASLPQQLVHGDFDGSNILMDGGRVVGILDFEFAHTDLRIADLADALFWWHPEALGTGAEWTIMEALARGFTAHLPLLPGEERALPVRFRLRAIGGLLRDLGWHARGRIDEQRVLEHAAYTLMRERWLQQNESRLLTMVESWPRAR